jgi:hypothetical protein
MFTALLCSRHHVYLCAQSRVATGCLLGGGFNRPRCGVSPLPRAGKQPCEPTQSLTNHISRRS